MIAFVLIFLFSATLLISEEFIPLTFFLAKWLAFLGWRWKITTHKKTSMFKNFYPSWTHSDWLSCWKAIYAYRLVIACKYFTGCCVCGRKYTCYSLGDFPRNYLCDECNNSSQIKLIQSPITNKYKQLNPALTDFKGVTIFCCYKWKFFGANIGNKKKQVDRTMILHSI